MRHLTLTGASGFIGRNLKSYLELHNYHVQPISIRYGLPIPCFDSDVLIHLAGKAHDLKNVSRAEEYYQVNTELTKQLFDVFLASNAKKFIFISSVKAVADHTNESLNEQQFPQPQTDYGKSKLLAEEYILSKNLPEGKFVYILRPCMIHGPGNKGNLNLLYKLVSKGIPYPLSAFENKRSFLSVENLCLIIEELIEHDIRSGIYHLADDVALSTNDIIKLISKSLDKKPKLWAIPTSVMKVIAKLGDVLYLPLNSERLSKLTENYVVDNTKIKQAIGKSFPLSSSEGIMKTVNSFNKIS